jgi:hypothetical protein
VARGLQLGYRYLLGHLRVGWHLLRVGWRREVRGACVSGEGGVMRRMGPTCGLVALARLGILMKVSEG